MKRALIFGISGQDGAYLARLLLSPRAYHRVLRVARSIADLAGAGTVGAEHVAEAIQYRRLDASF